MTHPAPRVRILSTGSEILQGLYPDTNAQMLSRSLLEAGFRVISHGAAPDDRALQAEAIAAALHDCELVVTTGGLGPTEDDLLRFVVAHLYGLELQLHTEAAALMRARFEARGLVMPPSNNVQAMMPAGCMLLPNHWGTAAGFVLPGDATGRPALMALPGPPSECRPMLAEALAGPLADLFPGRPCRAVETLHIATTPESLLNEALRDIIGPHDDGSEVTILASRGHLRLRIAATAPESDALDAQIARHGEEILRRVGPSVYAMGPAPDTTIAEAMVRALGVRGQTLALAESCTGGWIGRMITDVAGASAVLMAGYITYSNAAKVRDLGVDGALIESHGAVSEAVARAMAEGARRRAATDWGVAVTGIAGPDGGTNLKPVGTVWLAVAGPSGTTALHRRFPGDRESIRQFAVYQALELLRRVMLGLEPEPMLLAGKNGPATE